MNAHPLPKNPLFVLTTTCLRAASIRTASTLALTLSSALYAADKHRIAPPAKPAGQYIAVDAHPAEHVTMAAEPCDDPRDCSFFRLPYVQHGLLPIRLIITNDGDTALSLDDARIQFLSAANDAIPAATPDDISRRLFTMRSVRGTTIPLPAPIPNITLHHAPIDKQVTLDDTDFGFPGTIVNAHSTLAGYLFYDVRSLDDPALKDAQLYIKMVHTLDGKKQLFAFTIPFNKWLAAQTAAQPADQKASTRQSSR